MTISPAIKGQLTKAVKASEDKVTRYRSVKKIYQKIMPMEQAKHATRVYLSVLDNYKA